MKQRYKVILGPPGLVGYGIDFPDYMIYPANWTKDDTSKWYIFKINDSQSKALKR